MRGKARRRNEIEMSNKDEKSAPQHALYVDPRPVVTQGGKLSSTFDSPHTQKSQVHADTIDGIGGCVATIDHGEGKPHREDTWKQQRQTSC